MNLSPEIQQRLQIKIRAQNGNPAMVYNPKGWITPMDAARLAQILPLLCLSGSRDIPWHDVIREMRIAQHFDVWVEPPPVDDGKPTPTPPATEEPKVA